MYTRSGLAYLEPYKCVKCGIYYGSDIYRKQCSACFGITKSNDELVKECDTWASSQVMSYGYLSALRGIVRTRNEQLIYNTVKEFKKAGERWILSKDALTFFLMNPTNTMGHLFASITIDWWNINSKTTLWPSYLSCYYGNFNEPISGSNVPPRMPNNLDTMRAL